MSVIEIADRVKKELREGPLNEILCQYTDFWEGTWGEGIPIVVTVGDWTFSRKGLAFYNRTTGMYIPWLETPLVTRLDFIEKPTNT